MPLVVHGIIAAYASFVLHVMKMYRCCSVELFLRQFEYKTPCGILLKTSLNSVAPCNAEPEEIARMLMMSGTGQSTSFGFHSTPLVWQYS